LDLVFADYLAMIISLKMAATMLTQCSRRRHYFTPYRQPEAIPRTSATLSLSSIPLPAQFILRFTTYNVVSEAI
jgi:hypothetical protein